jgi:hypothetical protein
MAAPVVPHQPEVLGERLDLIVPHAVRGAERVRQHQHGRVFAALHVHVNRAAVGFDRGHRALLG